MTQLKSSQKITKKKMQEYQENQKASNIEDPQPGWYKAKVAELNIEDKKNRQGVKQLAVAYQITNHQTYGGAYVWERVQLPEELGGELNERNEWKYIQFFTAVGELDPDKGGTVNSDTDEIKGRPVLLRVRGGNYNGEYRAEVGTVLPPSDDDKEEEVEEEDEDEFEEEGDEDSDEDEEEEEEEDEEDDEFEDDEDEEEEDEDEEKPITSDYIDGLTGQQLKELLKEHNVKRPSGVKKVSEVRQLAKDRLVGVPF